MARSKPQVTAHTGKYVEQGEHFSVGDGSANLHCCYENQNGASSENW